MRNSLRLATSRDRASTWSAPLTIRAPGVAWATRPAIAVRAPGDVAIAYLGSAESEGTGDGWLARDGRPYDGYVTACRDVHGPDPTFVSVRARDGAGPLLPHGESAMTSGEYLGPPAFAADGSIWAGFLSLAEHEGSVVARARLR